MSYDYSENILVQESAGHLLERELGWQVPCLQYGTTGQGRHLCRTSYREIPAHPVFSENIKQLNPWLTLPSWTKPRRKWSNIFPLPPDSDQRGKISGRYPRYHQAPRRQDRGKESSVIDFQNPMQTTF